MSHSQSTVPASARGARRDQGRDAVIAGVVVISLCVVIGVFILMAGARPQIPTALWVVLLLLWLVTALLSNEDLKPVWLHRAAYAAAILLSWALVLTLANVGGMIELILVVTATLGVYLIPLRLILGVVVLNTGVIVLSAAIRSAETFELLFFAIFYLMIHLATVLSTTALAREGSMRRQLEEKNVELTTASILLEDSTRTAERLRISRELHDLIGHQLTVLNLELEAARHRGATGAHGADQHIIRAGTVAKELLNDVRATVGTLRAQETPDLQGALERIAQAVPHMSVRVSVDPAVAVDEYGTEALIRAAQEAATNTLKHSEAHLLTLTVVAREGEVVLTAEDDGSAPTDFTEGNGIRGIRERFELLEGAVEVTTAAGFRIQARLPLPEVRT